MQNNGEKIWCVVPAAGIGTRMQSSVPKQYLKLGRATILDTTLERLLSCEAIENIVVCVQHGDPYWKESMFATHSQITVVIGGEERSDTVLNGIQAIKQQASSNDWVLVHDAARPCVRRSDIDLLTSAALANQLGAILASPIHDTIKKVSNSLSEETLDRSTLWRALTPQLFKLNELEQALISAKQENKVVTDEASAIEQFNKPVQIIKGHSDNIKVTSPADLNLAMYYLEQQDKEQCV